MNWTAINAIAQIVAAVGVIGTLFYLALQVRQNTRSLRRAAYQELLNHVAQINLVAMDRDVAQMMVHARSGAAGLDEVDQLRWGSWFFSLFRHYQNAYDQYRAGVITHAQWEVIGGRIGGLLSNRGRRESWEAMAPAFSPAFRQVVEQRCPRPAPGPAARD